MVPPAAAGPAGSTAVCVEPPKLAEAVIGEGTEILSDWAVATAPSQPWRRMFGRMLARIVGFMWFVLSRER